MKMGDVVVIADDDDEDDVRSKASQNNATAILCTEEFFLRTQNTCSSSPLISKENCGGRQDIHRQWWVSYFHKVT